MTTEILRPLGMTATVWQAGDVPPGRRAIGYHNLDGRLAPEPVPSQDAFDAAGGLWTSLRDYARYVAFQLAAYPPGDAPESGPLRRSTVREMHKGHQWTPARPASGRHKSTARVGAVAYERPPPGHSRIEPPVDSPWAGTCWATSSRTSCVSISGVNGFLR